MRILGVDPGLRTTGYGVIDVDGERRTLIEGGVVQPRVDMPLERRLAELHEAMLDIVRTTHPDCMVVEELWTAYKNPTTAVLMGHARGVIALAAGTTAIALHHLSHSMVKRVVGGSGGASKLQVNAMVVRMLALREAPQPNDVSDALALALAYANVAAQQQQFGRLGIVVHATGATHAVRG